MALVQNLAAGSTTVTSWLQKVSAGMMRDGTAPAAAQQKALDLLNLKVQAQAATLAFEKIFLLMGMLFVASLPLLLLFRTGKVKGGAGPAH